MTLLHEVSKQVFHIFSSSFLPQNPQKFLSNFLLTFYFQHLVADVQGQSMKGDVQDLDADSDDNFEEKDPETNTGKFFSNKFPPTTLARSNKKFSLFFHQVQA